MLDLFISLSKDVLPKLAAKASLSKINEIKSEISWKGTVRTGRGFLSFISNGNINDIIEIVESLEKSGLLTDGVTQEVKEQEGEFLCALMIPMAALLIVPMALH